MRIVVAMSGGVDSSVAALSLVEAGYEVIGLSMQLYDQQHGEGHFGGCCSIDDLHDARRTASQLGIKHYIVNFEKQFEKTVVSTFLREYSVGRTPIPCVQCNGDLKFSHLLERATAFGADFIATGHYARLAKLSHTGQIALRKGLDPLKDQSYFLFSLTQSQLTRAKFPIGHLSKEQVRSKARASGLAVAGKPDSQELCFIPNGNTSQFVEKRSPTVAQPGPIRDRLGLEVGRHTGLHHYTVGQRKGLGLSTSIPLYVLEMDAADNSVTVGPRDALERTELTASKINWIAGPPLDSSRPIMARIRHRHPEASASLELLPDNRVSVTFDEPQVAVAPGQAVVFYDNDTVLGGGWID